MKERILASDSITCLVVSSGTVPKAGSLSVIERHSDYVSATREALERNHWVDLIVWPEMTITAPIGSRLVRELLDNLEIENLQLLVTGCRETAPGRRYSSLAIIGSGAEIHASILTPLFQNSGK